MKYRIKYVAMAAALAIIASVISASENNDAGIDEVRKWFNDSVSALLKTTTPNEVKATLNIIDSWHQGPISDDQKQQLMQIFSRELVIAKNHQSDIADVIASAFYLYDGNLSLAYQYLDISGNSFLVLDPCLMAGVTDSGIADFAAKLVVKRALDVEARRILEGEELILDQTRLLEKLSVMDLTDKTKRVLVEYPMMQGSHFMAIERAASSSTDGHFLKASLKLEESLYKYYHEVLEPAGLAQDFRSRVEREASQDWMRNVLADD